MRKKRPSDEDAEDADDTGTGAEENPRPDQGRSAPDVTEGRLLISDLLQIVEQYLDSKEVKAIYRAYLFGAEAHEGQVRHSGEAYIFPPIVRRQDSGRHASG